MNQQYDTNNFKRNILNNYFDRTVKIPLILEKRGIESLLDKRIKAVCEDAVQTIFEQKAFDRLFKIYHNRSLRDLIWISKISIEKAWRDGAEKIELKHVKDAELECFM